MSKYRKKPVEIEAEQFVIWDLNKMPDYVKLHGIDFIVHKEYNPYIEIPTIEGVMKAKHLDFIIKGIKGEIYPCDEDIFKKTYEKV